MSKNRCNIFYKVNTRERGRATDNIMSIKFFTFSQYHNKPNTGSTKIRAENLIKYWPEAALYRYGDKADVMVFQKVYCTYDYKFIKHFKGLKILDVCDIEWHNSVDIYIKETLDNIDAVVVPTEPLRGLLQQMTAAPVKIIKDRFDLEEFPAPKTHTGNLKKAVWFGYSHNAELLRFAVPSLEARNIELIVISNEDPTAYKWANDPQNYIGKYTFIKYEQQNIYDNLQLADVCVLPKGYRPEDKYKSENKTIIAQLCGLPVVQDAAELTELETAKSRDKYISDIYDNIKTEYDCRKSVEQYKELIDEIQSGQNQD